jgi:xylulokinase
MTSFLGIDLGTSAVKVLLVDANGKVLGRGTADYPISRPQPDHAEQDPATWWRAPTEAVRLALANVGQSAMPEAIGLSGQMHGTVLLNAADRPLAPAIIWPDQRSARQVAEITQKVGARHLIRLAGSPVATGFQAATIRWFQQERPDLWRQVRRILLPKDYLRWRLTQSHATDPSDAAGTLLFDVHRRTWSPEFLDALDVDDSLLPPIQPSTSIAGHLDAAAAREMSLPAGIPVVTGAADTACSALGAGIVEPDRLLLTLSTGGQLVLPTVVVRTDKGGRLHTFCTALTPAPSQAGWYLMGATLTAGLALRWLRDQIFSLEGQDAYHRMTAWAELVPLGADGLLFLPYLSGERTPHMDPHARGLFLGLTAGHGRAELVRAVLEGVIFSCYDAYRPLVDLAGDPAHIILAGGGARSPLWQQIVADVFGRPVQPLTTAEQSALGAAWLAGAGIDRLAVTSAGSWARYGPVVEPDTNRHARYQHLFSLYRSAYVQNRESFLALGDATLTP